MHPRAAQLLLRESAARDALDHVGTGNKHIADGIHHEYEIGQGGSVGSGTCAGAKHHGDLRHGAGCQRGPMQHIRAACQSVDRLINARAAGIVDSHNGATALHGTLQRQRDLLSVTSADGACLHRKILRKNEHSPSPDSPIARDNAVIGDSNRFALRMAVVADLRTGLTKAAAIQQELHPFNCVIFLFLML